jgi:hypothetical protein
VTKPQRDNPKVYCSRYGDLSGRVSEVETPEIECCTFEIVEISFGIPGSGIDLMNSYEKPTRSN